VVDEFTRERLETYVDSSIPAAKVIEILAFLFLLHGQLAYLRNDNGPEFVGQAIQQWLAEHSKAPGTLPPDPRDLPPCPSEQKEQKENRPISTSAPADTDSLIETQEDAKHSEVKSVEVGNPPR